MYRTPPGHPPSPPPLTSQGSDRVLLWVVLASGFAPLGGLLGDDAPRPWEIGVATVVIASAGAELLLDRSRRARHGRTQLQSRRSRSR